MIKNSSFKEIFEISRKVFSFAEIGSEEFRTSKLLSSFLRKKGFVTKIPYKGMKTSFRAEYGKGRPSVCFLAEEDALPNGHSCGHNLIAAWAVGTAVKLKDSGYKGKIIVIGTPSEEGIGNYAGSKDKMVKEKAFDNVDFVIGFHPYSQWNVGCQSPLDVDMKMTFIGKSSHLEESDMGRNALDALVTVYNTIRNIVAASPKYKHVLAGMFIKEGGQAANIVPEKSILEIDLRSTNERYFKQIYNKITRAAHSIGRAYGVKVKIEDTTPIYEQYINSVDIDEVLFKNFKDLRIVPEKLYSLKNLQIGATDEANVSRVVPTGHIDMKITQKNVPGHSDEFRDASGSKEALEVLKKTINVTVKSCMQIYDDKTLLNKIYAFKKKLKTLS